MRNSQLQRKQLEAVLSPLRMLQTNVPPKGWLHAIRHALEMPLSTIAKRLGQSTQNVKALELREASGNVTLHTLRQAAEAIDCELLYFIVPKRPLNETIDAMAEKLANTITQGVTTSMILEEQQTSKMEEEDVRASLIEKLRNNPKSIWRGLNEI